MKDPLTLPAKDSTVMSMFAANEAMLAWVIEIRKQAIDNPMSRTKALK